MGRLMQEMSAGEFKTHCLHLMEQVRKQLISILITKRGIPIAKLVPVDATTPKNLFGCMRNSVTINEDIVQPLDLKWNVESE